MTPDFLILLSLKRLLLTKNLNVTPVRRGNLHELQTDNMTRLKREKKQF